MVSKTKILKKICKIDKRLKAIEVTNRTRKNKTKDKHDQAIGDHFCAMPTVAERTFSADVSRSREELIRVTMKKWVNGTVLRYYFFNSGRYAGPTEQINQVRKAFGIWEQTGLGITFKETSNIEEAEVRIGFLRGDGAWSYLGRDILDIPGQYERTMNFGWDITADTRGLDTPVHEIGHTLGFTHEHQNPFAGIEWDEDAVYEYFAGAPNNWPRETTFHNVLKKNPPASVDGSDWDPNSIMHYGFGRGLIIQPYEYRNGLTPELGLSESDIEEALKMYPPIPDRDNEELSRFDLKRLSLPAGGQVNYNIKPKASDDYTIRTFGGADTVMVIFEDVDGELRKLKADDDSGESRNAEFTVRLQQGRHYILRIRLYSNYASGETAVMMW